jgi:Beta-lactamase
MKREILKPAGMEKSFFGAWPDAPLERASAGHQEGKPIPGKRGTLVELAAGGLWSTPGELAALTVVLQGVLADRPHSIVERKQLEAALRPVLSNAPTGLGFAIENGGRTWGHDGLNAGFQARWRADGKRAVILMANAQGSMPLMDEVARAIAVAHGWKDLAPPRMKLADLAAGFRKAPIHVRGSMNDWGLSPEPLKETPAGSGRWMTTLQLAQGTHEFKFATADWKTVDLGAAEPRTNDLIPAGDNLQFVAPSAGRYVFELDASDPAQPKWKVSAETVKPSSTK